MNVRVCLEFLLLNRQRILVKKLLEKIDRRLPNDAAEVVVHQYARCYILTLLADTIFADKSGNRVHTMWLQMLRDLYNPPQYSWGSACLAWLYRELCRAPEEVPVRLVGPCYWFSIGHGSDSLFCAQGRRTSHQMMHMAHHLPLLHCPLSKSLP